MNRKADLAAVGQSWRNCQSGLRWRITELLDDNGQPLVRLERDGSASPPPISATWLAQAYRPAAKLELRADELAATRSPLRQEIADELRALANEIEEGPR